VIRGSAFRSLRGAKRRPPLMSPIVEIGFCGFS
jgi:hypothetical protein